MSCINWLYCDALRGALNAIEYYAIEHHYCDALLGALNAIEYYAIEHYCCNPLLNRRPVNPKPYVPKP